MKKRPVIAELSHGHGRTNEQKDMIMILTLLAMLQVA